MDPLNMSQILHLSVHVVHVVKMFDVETLHYVDSNDVQSARKKSRLEIKACCC